MPSTYNLSNGMAITHRGQPWIIVKTTFCNPGNYQAFTRALCRNLKTNQVVEFTFKNGEAAELLDMQKNKCQYLYNDGESYHFMDQNTFDQFSLTKQMLGDAINYLLDGTECYALIIEGNPISVQLPPKMDFKVIETTPGVKGDTASGGDKECTIETGIVVKVPLFIKEGDVIKVNTETGEYVGKA